MRRVLFFIWTCVIGLVASAQFKSYDYLREIKPVTENGYYKIKIGSAVIDRAGHYRIFEFGKDTMEVPHIIEEYDNSTYDKSYFKYLNIIDKSFNLNKASYATLIVDSGITYNALYLNYNAPEF